LPSQVALVRCDTYDEAAVDTAVQRGLDLLGGMGRYIRPGEKIVLKPNVLYGDVPGKHISPHPLVFQAVARLAQAVTPHLSYGDSPSLGRSAGHMRRAGFAAVAASLGIPLADFDNGPEVEFKDSPFTKRFALANGVVQADGLISLCKLKTHGYMRFTGAVKNQFGCVPGMAKPGFHIKLPGVEDFGRMLVCLNLYIRPRLYIMDGIVAMEGNGPRSGDPVPMRVLLLSADPVALDAVACRLIDLDPKFVPTMEPGQAWGLGTYRPEEIELLGDPIEPFINQAFNAVHAPGKVATNSPLLPVFRNLVFQRPVLDPAECRRCGACVRVCPVEPKAVDWRAGDKTHSPVHHYERCIRCFCCQEICPESAITVQRPLLGRLMERF
jgi:uncharacterized protein (DUF362 family)/ferredoxin